MKQLNWCLIIRLVKPMLCIRRANSSQFPTNTTHPFGETEIRCGGTAEPQSGLGNTLE